MSEVTDLAAGTAAEHLVCADLLLAGYRAFLADQSCPYDVAVDLGDRLVKVQVKATRGPRTVPQRVGRYSCYSWGIRRAGKAGRRVYADDAFDLCALVALDTREIAYVPFAEVRQTFQIRPTAAPPLRLTTARGEGTCSGCGTHLDEKTPGCPQCRSRAWHRENAPPPQRGKRFADYPFARALGLLSEEVMPLVADETRSR